MNRAQVLWAQLPEPWGERPVLLVARDDAYAILNWVVIAPLTTTIRLLPSTVLLTPEDDGVPQPSVVTLDQIQLVKRDRLGDLLTTLSPARMRDVDRALHFALGLRD